MCVSVSFFFKVKICCECNRFFGDGSREGEIQKATIKQSFDKRTALLWQNQTLVGNKNVDHRVQVVEKRQKVKCHLAPALIHGVVEFIAIHDRCWIVQTGLK